MISARGSALPIFLMDGVGALGALLAGWVASLTFSITFLLSGLLAVLAVLACFSVTFNSPLLNPSASAEDHAG